MQLLEAEHRRPIDQLLRDLYEGEGLNVDEIAARLRLTKGTVSRWMARFGIATRRPRDRKVAV
jgi:transposase